MTEQEWLQATDPTPMLEFLRGRVSERKLRLFAVACCRRIWHLLIDEKSRKVVEAAERFADGTATTEELAVAREAAEAALKRPEGAVAAIHAALEGAGDAAWYSPSSAAYSECIANLVSFSTSAMNATRDMASKGQTGILRCMFGNPFHSITLDSDWLTWHDGLLVSMAQRMYDSRDFSDMPVLADALEEAGCQDQNILGHCRSGGEHVRGCWVVDALLGRE